MCDRPNFGKIVDNLEKIVYDFPMATEAEIVYKKLKRDIVLCKHAPGTSLGEVELCTLYKTGRTPVREACRRLQDKGLLEVQPFRGCFVTPLDPTDYKFLSDAARLIEPETAALAAKHASKEDIKKIEDFGEIGYLPGDESSYLTFLDANYNFHTRIASAGGNPILEQTVTSVQDRLMRYFLLVIESSNYSAQLLDEHHAVIRAIRDRDPENARSAALEHQQNTYERSLSALLDALGRDLKPWPLKSKRARKEK